MGLTKKSLAPDGTSGWWKEGDKVKSGREAWQVQGGQWKKAKILKKSFKEGYG